ncbi:hypothetical protein IM816_15525 [Luteibacter flocculans]|uniref:Uncharacterized protein n=1 Tax=Luteibacter flocculans TaxID=2780091 RepID=A0ABY4T242_9GAMM|nr:hypothetical protein [Luteibacter flocculans]URL57997.1 hypothetical protein IM816_15525 [Luteibacter flocculans]
MRVQLEDDTVRVRINEDELTELLQDVALLGSTSFGMAFTMRYAIDATDADACTLSGTAHEWRMEVPRDALRELQAKLPSKDGLTFDIPGRDTVATTVRFDVDVKDSLRRRRA